MLPCFLYHPKQLQTKNKSSLAPILSLIMLIIVSTCAEEVVHTTDETHCAITFEVEILPDNATEPAA